MHGSQENMTSLISTVENAMAECMSAFGYNTNCAVNCEFNASIIIKNHGLKPCTAFSVLSLRLQLGCSAK